MSLDTAKPHRLSHALVLEGSETLAFGSLATTPSYSTVLEAKGFKDETFYFSNTTDQTLTVQLQASPDGLPGSDWYDVGASSNITTAAKGFIAAGSDYHPFIRVKITHSLAPTSGSLSIKARAQAGA